MKLEIKFDEESLRSGSNDDAHRDPDAPIFAPPTQKTRKTMKVTKGDGPAVQVELSFVDLTVAARKQSLFRGVEKKLLLQNVSGYVPAGDILMVLGSSGCGKSTLLETIANVTSKNIEVKGDVFFNNRRLRPSDRRQILSFVSQESALLGEYTVSETLWFAARLYFGYFETPRDLIQAKIDHIIEGVGLEECADVRVGNLFFRGLSGGQRKRLGIAVELISSPSVIVLDEPTSGLDSTAALSLMQSLQGLAKIGHTIIASIHQPSSKIWSSFSNILLMSQGRCVYFGSCAGSVSYFTSIGYPCPDHFNPADFFSAVLSTDFPWEGPNRKSPDELATLYESSATRRMELLTHLETVDKGRATLANQNKRTSTRLVGRLTSGSSAATAPAGGVERKYDNLMDEEHKGFFNRSAKHSGFFSSTWTLLYRALKSLYRDPGLLLVRVVVYIALGLTLGLIYLNVGREFDTEALLARVSVLLGCVGFFSFLSVSAVPFILDNRAVFYRERKNGTYNISSYVIANTLSLLPATLLLSIIAIVIVGLMAWLNNFGLLFLGLWIQLFCAECLVQCVACFFTSKDTAVGAAVAAFGFVFLCSGFFIPVDEMSWGTRWIAYISPIHYAFRMFIRNEFESITTTNSAQFPNGDAMMDYFGLNNGLVRSYWGDLGIVVAFALAYVFIIYVDIRLSKSR